MVFLFVGLAGGRKNHGVFRSGKKSAIGGREETRLNLSFCFFVVLESSPKIRENERKKMITKEPFLLADKSNKTGFFFF